MIDHHVCRVGQAYTYKKARESFLEDEGLFLNLKLIIKTNIESNHTKTYFFKIN
jgi:hypothetical protein